jgi:hypothetical protein
MTETLTKRMQRLVNEKRQEDMAATNAQMAAEKTKKLAELAAENVDAKLAALKAELDPQTDAELKSQGNRFLYSKLAQSKEAEEEKARRGGGMVNQ